MDTVWTSPAVALVFFVGIVYMVYFLAGRIAAKGKDLAHKHQPYACGEDLQPPRAQLNYHSFFHLALLFGILHLAALVLSTLPDDGMSHRLATVFLLGAVISVFVLTGGEAGRA